MREGAGRVPGHEEAGFSPLLLRFKRGSARHSVQRLAFLNLFKTLVSVRE